MMVDSKKLYNIHNKPLKTSPSNVLSDTLLDVMFPSPYTKIALCNEDGTIKESPKCDFEVGELVVIKNVTYKVAYVNSSSVTFERIPLAIKGR